MTAITPTLTTCDVPKLVKSRYQMPLRRVNVQGPAEPDRRSDMAQFICAVPDCNRGPHQARGLCRTHYGRWQRLGDPLGGRPLTAIGRFHTRYTVMPNRCWIWNPPLSSNGYGLFGMERRNEWAHRAGYMLLVGPISAGLELDHLCRTPACVNPAHLEPVTHAENMRRGKVAQKTHCKHGHAFSPENTYHRPDAPNHRMCRRCGLDSLRRNYQPHSNLLQHQCTVCGKSYQTHQPLQRTCSRGCASKRHYMREIARRRSVTA